jgi:poly(A) polymerase Pap1
MLTTFYDILTDISILIIDDWNWEQRGILEAIENLNFDVLYNKEIYTSGEDPNDFWNGLGIFLLEK